MIRKLFEIDRTGKPLSEPGFSPARIVANSGAFASRCLVGGVLLVGALHHLSIAQPSRASSGRIPLWSTEHPVCILAVNRDDPDLELPEPYFSPPIQEVLGPGTTELDLPALDKRLNKAMVGANVTFSVLYADGASEGFNDPTLGTQRRAAFEFALGIWADRLQGPGTVTVTAEMTPRGGSPTSAVLASAGPVQVWREFTNAPFANTWYPEALVEVISGSDPDLGTEEIAVDFNSDVDNGTVLGSCDWYYGTDATPTGCDIDFVTVTIHEIAHGLGFVSTGRSNGQFGLGNPSFPIIYDLFLVNSEGTPLLNISGPSKMTNPVFWDGTVGVWGHTNNFGGVGNAVIYAPSTFSGGSSISHVDETTYTGVWDLQTPFHDEPNHDPDRVMFGILEDIGWSRPDSRYALDAAAGFEDGSSANPFDAVSDAATAVPSSGFVRLFPGTFSETILINTKPMLIDSYGPAVIGEGAETGPPSPVETEETRR